MTLEPGGEQRSSSPFSSDRLTAGSRGQRRELEDALYKKDKAFRRYGAGIKQALLLFDTAQQDWADYISFLGRLLKAIQAHPSDIPFVPQSSTIATRLAQCLNPSLPSGVHQKSLEVYAYIFSVLGKHGLSRDFHLYFPGLSSVLSFASLTVRPLYLSLFESYVLKLDREALRPSLKAVILSLLPGLEDDTSEDFEAMAQAMQKLRKVLRLSPSSRKEGNSEEAGDSYFWQCFFLATITNPSRRQGALAYLVRYLPRFSPEDERRPSIKVDDPVSRNISDAARAAVSPEPGLLIRCFTAGLADSQILIQRGFLDLLVSHLPLHTEILQEGRNQSDTERLVAAAVGVVIRRDMSLNRRLWSWFLGPELLPNDGSSVEIQSPSGTTHDLDSNAYHAEYFSKFGLRTLTRSIMTMIDSDKNEQSDRARPFRMCLSLMDRWEIGGLIVPEIFIPAIKSLQSFSEIARKEQLTDVMRSASIFFDGVESTLIWDKLISLVITAFADGVPNSSEQLGPLKVAKFIIMRFNIREEDMLMCHMPLMALVLLRLLNTYLVSGKAVEEEGANAVIILGLELMEVLIQNIPERAFQDPDQGTSKLQKEEQSAFGIDKLLRAVSEFYTESNNNPDQTTPPFDNMTIRVNMLSGLGELCKNILSNNHVSLQAEMCARLFAVMVAKSPDLSGLRSLGLVESFQSLLQTKLPQEGKTVFWFSALNSIIAILLSLRSSPDGATYPNETEIPGLVQALVSSIWEYLSPLTPKFHVESVRCLWQLQSLSPDCRIVEAALTRLMTETPGNTARSTALISAEAGRRIAIIWNHSVHEQSKGDRPGRAPLRRQSTMAAINDLATSHGGFQVLLTRPLLLLLESLDEANTEVFIFVKFWLQELPTLNKVFDLLMTQLSYSLLTVSEAVDTPSAEASSPHRTKAVRDYLYYLMHLLNILRWPSNYTWAMLADQIVPLKLLPINSPDRPSYQMWIVRASMRAISLDPKDFNRISPLIELQKTGVLLLTSLLSSPFALPLKNSEIEAELIEILVTADPSLQSLLLESLVRALRLRATNERSNSPMPTENRRSSKDSNPGAPTPAATTDVPESDGSVPKMPTIPPYLFDSIKTGFSSPSNYLILDEWVKFLTEVLDIFSHTMLQNTFPLVECFCRQIEHNFSKLENSFRDSATNIVAPEPTIIALMNGLEQILSKVHDQLVVQESKIAPAKTPEVPQGFFGNMVSGVFSVDAQMARKSTSNSRLAMTLCFQDTVRTCFTVWSWHGYGSASRAHDSGSAASINYTSLRLRNRARKVLENLFAAEALECLETLAVLWSQTTKSDTKNLAIFGLLNVLNGSRPKNTVPAIFDAIYSRTNPAALDSARMSTLSSDLSEIDLVAFLVNYTESLEDDAMDEIWPDCSIFLKDVLANPMPHRAILPILLQFISTLGLKIDNTNFGEQRRLRREIADILTRLLAANFTTRPMGFVQDTSKASALNNDSDSMLTNREVAKTTDVLEVLASIAGNLLLILVESERVNSVATNISNSIVGPSFRAKNFPNNISHTFLEMLYQVAKVAQLSKAWKKDVSDAFNDTRFFSSSHVIAKDYWLPILQQWTLGEKDRLSELLSRLFAPTTAGIMFGVGAASARIDADRKTQLNLRRISALLLAATEDAFATDMKAIQDKIIELLSATPASSPSSGTRAEVFLLLRALVLKTSPHHLAPFWPIISSELNAALLSIIPDDENYEKYNNASLLQVCKLLDTLIALDPDDFQLHEWLFVTDTIDAVYRPPDVQSLALTDILADTLTETQLDPDSALTPSHQVMHSSPHWRRPFLDPLIENLGEVGDAQDVAAMARPMFVERVLRPFLGQLSLLAFEQTYSMGRQDWEACRESLLKDLFNE